MDRKQYLIPKQLKSLSNRDAQILKLLGIDFAEYAPSPEQQDILLCNVDFSVRAINILQAALGSWEHIKNMKISEFVGDFSERELLRYRNCGKKTIREINNALYPYGFELTKGR